MTLAEETIRALGAWGLLERLALEHRVTTCDVLGPRKRPNEVRARDRFLFILWGSTGLALIELDRQLGLYRGACREAVEREERRAKERCAA